MIFTVYVVGLVIAWPFAMREVQAVNEATLRDGPVVFFACAWTAVALAAIWPAFVVFGLLWLALSALHPKGDA